MARKNPKWNKKHAKRHYGDKKIGKTGEESTRCSVKGCNKKKKRTLSRNSVSKVVTKLDWTLDTDKKARKVSLCKNHYKDYSKVKKKEDKYKKMRDYGQP